MSRSLSTLEWRTALAHSAGVASRPTRSRSDADELREELRVLRESLRSLERPQHRTQDAAQDSHDATFASPARGTSRYAEYDARYRPGTAPTSARPPPSPASNRTNLDDSLREEVRHLTDNLRGYTNATRSSRSMSDVDGAEVRDLRTSVELPQGARNLRTSAEFSKDARHMRTSVEFPQDTRARENANIRLSDEAHDAYAAPRVHASDAKGLPRVASDTKVPLRAERRRRNNSEGGVPEEANNLDGSFVIPLSYNEYISVLAKRYQDKASHITKPSPNVSLPVPASSKKIVPKKKKLSTDSADRKKEWKS
eukprot:Phypoly_transcript_14074.p1 GENE.Phypoly_transcript_14074~~Phypoly_transcript_14074.p1  ORF type:complete len:333 (-),score=91.56 Phypoly_transcript_14074:21-953(-)